jgi:mono/diheme cytochrome c family protein
VLVFPSDMGPEPTGGEQLEAARAHADAYCCSAQLPRRERLSRRTERAGGRWLGARVVVALGAAIVWLSACGEASPRDGDERETSQTKSSLGQRIFLSQCQSCHALGPFGSPRPIGGDLANYDMTPAEVASFARIMPTPRRLSRAELAGVSSFVAERQRRSPSGPGRSSNEARPSPDHEKEGR